MIAVPVLLLMLWWLGDIITPFVAGAIIAWIVLPLKRRFEQLVPDWLAPPVVASLMALLVFVLMLVLAVGLLVPVFLAQADRLIERGPYYAEQARLLLQSKGITDGSSLLARLPDPTALMGDVAIHTGQVLRRGLTAGVVIADLFSVLVITPIVAFYLLLDLEQMPARLGILLPKRLRSTVMETAAEINKVLSRFLRGQLSLMLALGLFYGISLQLLGLDFGLVLGVFAGLISFLPVIGALLGGLLAVIQAVLQGPGMLVLLVVGVFVAGQILEGSVLTPWLVGDAVGLSPVWVLFALMAGAELYGLLGVLLALPVAASCRVVVMRLLRQYQQHEDS